MKKHGKKIILLALCLALLFVAAACGADKGYMPEDGDSADSEIILTDQAGNEVKLDAPAERIVSCYYITTYACISLGLTDRLVGIVIMPKRLSDSAEALKALGIPVLIVYPESQELLEEMLTLIGKACGAQERAESLLKYYDEAEKELAGYGEAGTGTKVYMAGVSSYLKTAPEGMYQAEMIHKAGGENAAGDMSGDAWLELSYEDILAMNPDVIIIPASAEYGREDVLGDANLAETEAVKNGAVYQMPKGLEEWDSPVPSGILGVRWLGSILHEDAYSREEMEKDVREFYRTFYGFEPENIVW